MNSRWLILVCFRFHSIRFYENCESVSKSFMFFKKVESNPGFPLIMEAQFFGKMFITQNDFQILIFEARFKFWFQRHDVIHFSSLFFLHLPSLIWHFHSTEKLHINFRRKVLVDVIQFSCELLTIFDKKFLFQSRRSSLVSLPPLSLPLFKRSSQGFLLTV